jgi:hypothetical protein
LTVLGFAAGGAFAAPGQLNLPLSVNTNLSVPASAKILADETKTFELSPTLHLSTATTALAPDFLSVDSAAHLAARAPQAPDLQLTEQHFGAAALQWDISHWASLGLTTVNTTGTTGLLGDFVPPALSFDNTLQTSGAGLAAHVSFGDGWVTSFSYNVDINRLDLRAGASAELGASTTRGQSYSISVAKRGLFGSADTLGLSVSRPSEAYFGGVSLADSGIENRVDLMHNYRSISLGNDAGETDIALGYVTSFFHGALALQANAGYQMNANGQNGANGVTVLSRAKINF